MPILTYDPKTDESIGHQVRVFTSQVEQQHHARKLQGYHPELWEKGTIIGIEGVLRIPFFGMSGYTEHPLYRIRLNNGCEVVVGSLYIKMETGHERD